LFDDFKGSWKGRTAGGCFNYPTWRNNPQYLLKTSEKGKVVLELTQNEDNHIGFYVLKADGKIRFFPVEGVSKTEYILVHSPIFERMFRFLTEDPVTSFILDGRRVLSSKELIAKSGFKSKKTGINYFAGSLFPGFATHMPIWALFSEFGD